MDAIRDHKESSATAGLISRVLCHPLDTIKSRLQAGQSAFRSTESFRALYRGVGAVVLGGVPGVCIYMTSYEAAKDTLSANSYFSNSPFATYLTAGMIAEAVCCIVFVPVDVIKERLQVQGLESHSKLPLYKGSIDAFIQISRQEGIRGMYKGYGATLVSYGPFSALYFFLYEELKKKCEAHLSTPPSSSSSAGSRSEGGSKVAPLPFAYTLACSALAGGVASAVTNPLDLAKLRLQIERGSVSTSPGDASAVRAGGMLNMIKRVYIQEGMRGLFRGAGARVLFHTPSTAITMAMFEECKKRFGQLLA